LAPKRICNFAPQDLAQKQGRKKQAKFNIGRSKPKQTELFFNLKLVLGKVISQSFAKQGR
jgi:hypothetical protein